MKKKIEIEIDLPDFLDENFIRYFNMLDKSKQGYFLNYFIASVMVTLRMEGKITNEELTLFYPNK